MNRRERKDAMKAIPRFVLNPEKADRGLKALADILAGAILSTELETPRQKATPSVP